MGIDGDTLQWIISIAVISRNTSLLLNDSLFVTNVLFIQIELHWDNDNEICITLPSYMGN